MKKNIMDCDINIKRKILERKRESIIKAFRESTMMKKRRQITMV